MPWGLKRYYGTGSLHFITWSCYRRKPLLGNPARRDLLLAVLETDARSLSVRRDRIRSHARTRTSADFRTFDWRSLEDSSGREAERLPAAGYWRRILRQVLAESFLRFQSVEPAERG